MTTQVPKPDRVVIDVRHCSRTETVLCGGQHDKSRWATHVLTYAPGAFGTLGKREIYMCRDHLSAFLLLADGLGVG